MPEVHQADRDVEVEVPVDSAINQKQSKETSGFLQVTKLPSRDGLLTPTDLLAKTGWVGQKRGTTDS